MIRCWRWAADGDIDKFPFLEPPDPRAIADGWQQLNELGAVDAQRKLTTIGGRWRSCRWT